MVAMVLFEMLVRRIKWVEHSEELMSYCLCKHNMRTLKQETRKNLTMNGRENDVPELMGLFCKVIKKVSIDTKSSPQFFSLQQSIDSSYTDTPLHPLNRFRSLLNRRRRCWCSPPWNSGARCCARSCTPWDSCESSSTIASSSV